MELMHIQYCVLESNRDDHYRLMHIDRSDIPTVPVISKEIATFHDKELAIEVTAILNAFPSEESRKKSLGDILDFIRGTSMVST